MQLTVWPVLSTAIHDLDPCDLSQGHIRKETGALAIGDTSVDQVNEMGLSSLLVTNLYYKQCRETCHPLMLV